MQIVLDFVSMVVGIALGGLITWLFVQSSKAERKKQDKNIFEKIFSLENGVFIAYDLLKWFRRPNRKKKKYKENDNEDRAYQNLFAYFLKYKLLERVSGEDPITYCLTKEGEKMCDILDEFSELLAQSITKRIK